MRHPRAVSLILALASLALATMVLAVAGDLDPTFSGDGVVTTDFSGSFDEAFAVAVDAAGRVVAAGYAGGPTGADFAVVRYDDDGNFDPAFGTSGIARTHLGASVQARGLAIDPAGRLVVVGTGFHVVRHLPDGTLDPAFGGGTGHVRVAFPFGGPSANAVALDHQGRIVIVGTVALGGVGNPALMGIARLLPDGAPDPTFGAGGTVTVDFGSTIAHGFGVAVDPSDRIVAIGRVYTGLPDYHGSGFAMVRLQEHGALDPGFGSGGRVTNDFDGRGAIGYAVALDADGRIVAAGSAYGAAPLDIDLALARYLPDGTLDPTFGSAGMVVSGLEGRDDARALALGEGGTIYAAGQRSTRGSRIGVTRLLDDGSLDGRFGIGGRVVTNPGWYGGSANAVALDTLGRIVVAGGTSGPTIYYDWAVARYVATGDEPSPSPPIDVIPYSSDNLVTLSDRGRVTVAVLSTPAIDAPFDVVAESLTFGASGDEASPLLRKDGRAACRAEDVSGDGRPDLVCDFLVKLTGLDTGTDTARLLGRTTAGRPIEASDRVLVLP